MFAWLKAALSRTVKTVSLVSPWLRGVVWTISRNFLVLAREGYGENSVVYACLRLLSQSVPEPPLLVYEVGADLQRKAVPFDHPLMQLIRQPNPLMTEYEMMELTTLHLGIIGRSHWFKQRDNLGRITALWPLRPDRVGPRYAGDANSEYASDATASNPKADQHVLAGWNYWPPGMGEPVQLDLSDVVTFNLPDPAGETGGMVEGLGPLQVLSREVEADNEATNYVAALLKNGAVPGSIITLKQAGVSKDQAQKVKRNFEAQFGGQDRGHTAVLDADTTFTQVGFNLQNLEFPNLRDISEARITSVFGTPAILVGVHAAIKSSIRATIAEQREYFAETTLANYWRRISDQWTNDVASEYGDRLVCRFDTSQVKALVQQSRYQIQPLQVAFGLGAITIDEYRVNVLNMQPLPNGAGNVLVIPTTSATSPADEDQSTIEDTESGDDAAFQGKRARRLVSLQRLALKEPSGANTADKTTVRANADQRVANGTQRYSGQLADYLALLRAKMVAELNADATAAPEIAAEDTATLTQLLTALWTSLSQDAYADTSALIGVGVSFDVTNPHVQDVLDQLAQRVKGIDDTTRQAIQDAVGQAAREGMSTEQLAGLINQSGVFAPSRAITIARTESATAYNKGSILAYRQSGVVQQVEVMDGTDFDDACRAANGSIWSLEDAENNPSQHPRCVRAFAPIVQMQAQGAAA